jgi:hypothetical protein
MDPHSQALSILQNARDALSARLAQRIIESEQEIVEDAEGGSYLSEIETIYDQLGGRLTHLNAMLANLPPAAAGSASDAASEVIYADLASSPSSTFDVDATGPLPILALPAPAAYEEEVVEQPLVEVFAGIVLCAQAGESNGAARLISELFDIKPSQARRGAMAFERQLARFPELGRRFEQLGADIDETNEYAAATLLGECFEFQPIDALLLVRSLKEHHDSGSDRND